MVKSETLEQISNENNNYNNNNDIQRKIKNNKINVQYLIIHIQIFDELIHIKYFIHIL